MEGACGVGVIVVLLLVVRMNKNDELVTWRADEYAVLEEALDRAVWNMVDLWSATRQPVAALP